MSIRLGYQMPNFTYGQPVRELFPTVVAQARAAEAAGFDTVFVMDHFYQLPGLGAPGDPMLESYTALSALAASTERIQLSALVTGNTYRNPALLAKTVTTLDLVSGARAVLGIGAGWYELEHTSYGFEFGTFTERFERLDEALQIIRPMLRGEHATLDGEWYRADHAMNEPRLRDDLPIMLGGSGEKKTFALAARYADHLNIVCNASELPRKMAALHQRCAEIGRDPATLEVSYLCMLFLDEDGDQARKQQRDFLRGNGIELSEMSEAERAQSVADRQFAGDAAEVAEQLQRRVLDHGVQGLVVNMITNGHQPGAVELAGHALAPLVR